MEPADPGWRTTSASLKGSSHGPASPNQDAVRLERVIGETETTWIAAVADGHGGARYVRSDVGARAAVDVAVETVAGLLGTGAQETDLLPTAAPLIVDAWRTSVRTHLEENPFTDEEATLAGALVENNPVLAYGATLLIAVVDDSGVRLAQIGDGDALVRSHGFAVRPIPGDDRLIANETTSLCLDSAATDFRFADLPSSADVDLVLLASDGYGNSFAAKDWWHTLVGDVAWYVDVHGFEEFSAHLPEWLAESALVGGDDVTAAVLSLPVDARPGPVVVPVAPVDATPAPSAAEAQHTMAAPEQPARRSRRGLVAALVVGLVAAAAAGGGYALMSRDADPAPTTPTTISPSPTDSSSPSPVTSGSPTPSEQVKKKRKNKTPTEEKLPGERDSGDIEQPPADVPDRPTDPEGTSKSDPGSAGG